MTAPLYLAPLRLERSSIRRGSAELDIRQIGMGPVAEQQIVVQLERFRQQYQLQHKHMAKIFEAMNFNIENCRTGGDMTPGDSMDIN